MYSLGINAAFHDCSAALVHDGTVIAAAEEERFTHVKHGKRPVPFTVWQLPFHAIDYCLRTAALELAQVDRIGYAFEPHLFRPDLMERGTVELPLEPSRTPPAEDGNPWEALALSYVVNAPRQLASGAPHHLKGRLGGLSAADIQARWEFVEHHLAHEASAFLAAPFNEAAVMTLDGRGETASTCFGQYRDRRYRRLRQIDLPDSLGLMYEEVTRYLGFLHSSDEYKVMALASYGRPAYLTLLRELVKLDGEGGYRIAPLQLEQRFGPPRMPGAPFTHRDYDLAASLQIVLEETVLHLARWLQRATGEKNLVMAGGVALNCVMNGRLLAEGPFERLWIQPAAGDAGTALGAALWVDAKARGFPERTWSMEHAYLGPEFSDDEIEDFLRWSKLAYRRLDDIAGATAALLAEGRIIGWFQGRMEFGPRALGARSILASPLDAHMQARLNEIKDREDFRPVAPVTLEEHATEWFRPLRGDTLVSPYMLLVCEVDPAQADRIPAVCHVDGSARVQTVRRDQHPLYHALLEAFHRRTGVPVLVNTSFNTRGEPIVCTPRDAVECFWTSPLDALVIGSFLLEKRP